jgi:hypothetical protein
LVPGQVLVIARAAAAASPAKAGEIVEAICRVLTGDYKSVAEAVAEVVPGAGKEILAGISTAIPALKNVIDQTVLSYQGSIPSVSTVLNQVAQTENSVAISTVVSGSLGTPGGGSSGTLLPQGPSVGAPTVPPSGTPTIITPGSGGTVPTGGRGYSAP